MSSLGVIDAIDATRLPGSATPVSAGRLPLPASSFVGRAHEVRDLSRRLPASRLVTLTGPSGIGKTRLAVEVARRLGPIYPGGVWLVEVAPLADPGLVPWAVAAALGVGSEPGRDPVDVIVGHLRGRRALLLLDNCEHVLEACRALCRALLDGAPTVSVVVTSQRAMAVPGETVVALAPLSLPDLSVPSADVAQRSEAVALFCARAQPGSPTPFRLTDAVAPAVAEICRRLDGIPLAIELAAARTSVLAPVEIAERLEDRFALLTRGPDTASARHQTLRAAVTWSFDLLSPVEAALLWRLSVFSGGASLRAVEEVCSGGEVVRREVRGVLAELVARSLVMADEPGDRPRYRLLETVRDFGRERLAEAAEQHAQRVRHARWCHVIAERAGHRLLAGDERWAEPLEAELDNVWSALEWAAAEAPDLGLRLAVAMTHFWKVRGQLAEGRSWLERTLRSTPVASAALRSKALWGVGMLSVLQGDVAAATPAVEESLAVARGAALARSEAQALNLLGVISIFSQDPLTAMPLLEESVAMNRAAGDFPLLLSSLAMYGRAHLFLGDVEAARRAFEECLKLAEDGGPRSAAMGLVGLGWAASSAGQHRQAVEHFRRALPLVRSASGRFETALVLSFLGELALDERDLTQARVLLDEGRDLAEAMGAPFPRVRCLTGLARLALVEVELATARALADEACALAVRAGLPYASVRCHLVQGDVRMAVDDGDGAERSFGVALATARERGDRAGIAEASARLARLAHARGDASQVEAFLSEAIVIQAGIPDAGGVATSLECFALQALGRGCHAHAARLFGAAEAIRDESGAMRPIEHEPAYVADVRRLRNEACEASVDEAWIAARDMTPAQAVALATRERRMSDRPSAGWASLTPSELEVVELVAQGMTNKEIGERLFVSGRTVQGRLLRIFPKLGLTSRRQLRDLAAEQVHGGRRAPNGEPGAGLPVLRARGRASSARVPGLVPGHAGRGEATSDLDR